MGNVNFVSFDSMRQKDNFKNTLTYRGVVRASGLTYDYMDKLNNFVKEGLFIDEKGDGFTNAEKIALMQEFTKIHLEKGYSTDFASMLPGTTFEYNYNDFIRMAQAAGYILKEEPPAEEDNVELQQAPAAVENENAPQQKSAEDLLFEELEADSELAGKSGEERLKILADRQFEIRRQLSELDKPATYRTKKFLFWGGKEKTRELTPEEKQERETLRAELTAKQDELSRMHKFVQEMEGKYWIGPYTPASLKDENGNILEDYSTYNRVTLVDSEGNERRAAEIVSYDRRNEYGYPVEERKYYSMEMKKLGDPTISQGLYWDIVPDMDNELKGYKLKEYTP